jgi:hypothetical protein
MSYTTNRIYRLSNPNINYSGLPTGVPIGTYGEADSAQAVSNVMSYHEAIYNNDSGDPPDDTVTVNLVTGFAGAENSNSNFSLFIPTGATDINFALSGGTGDADLVVKFGAPPSPPKDYDCYAGLPGNNENCFFSSALSAGTWYVIIYGYSAFSGVDLTVSYRTTAASAPSAPQIIDTDYGNEEIYLTVSDSGGSEITNYNAICSAAGIPAAAGTSSTPRITVSGLTNGVSYTCSVRATNAAGTSAPSASSPPVTPEYIPVGLPIWLLYEASKPASP